MNDGHQMAAQADCRLQTRGAATPRRAEPVLTVTRPAVGSQPQALGTLAVVAADGVAADAVAAAAPRSRFLALVDVWGSEEMKVKQEEKKSFVETIPMTSQ